MKHFVIDRIDKIVISWRLVLIVEETGVHRGNTILFQNTGFNVEFVVQLFVFCAMFCGPLSVLWFMASDYPFGIFKHFLFWPSTSQ